MTDSVAIVQSDHPADWHIQKLAEFTAAKAAVGEPSPHMKIMVHLTEGLPLAERMWRMGCYLNAYSVGTAEEIWESWSLPAARANPDGLANWITDNWEGFHTRTERRCVRTPRNFIRAQRGYLEWLGTDFRDLLSDRAIYRDPHQAYERWWRSVSRIPFFGRYINVRLVESANRLMPQLGLDLYDIRAIGGWSPVRALTLFSPEDSGILLSGDVTGINRVAESVYQQAREIYPEISYYVFAAMLCEYREAYEDHHQYPGRTHDQELEYSTSPKLNYWAEPPTAMWEARSALFPPQVLGEKTGFWIGVRHNLSRVLRDYGYVWSDLRYDYALTTDLGNPREWRQDANS